MIKKYRNHALIILGLLCWSAEITIWFLLRPDVAKLSEQDVRASLESQGYTHVHDVDFDNGIWKAKADNAAGNDVKLKVDARSGKVIGTD